MTCNVRACVHTYIHTYFSLNVTCCNLKALCYELIDKITNLYLVSDIAIFVLKRDVKLQLTNKPISFWHWRDNGLLIEKAMHWLATETFLELLVNCMNWCTGAAYWLRVPAVHVYCEPSFAGAYLRDNSWCRRHWAGIPHRCSAGVFDRHELHADVSLYWVRCRSSARWAWLWQGTSQCDTAWWCYSYNNTRN